MVRELMLLWTTIFLIAPCLGSPTCLGGHASIDRVLTAHQGKQQTDSTGKQVASLFRHRFRRQPCTIVVPVPGPRPIECRDGPDGLGAIPRTEIKKLVDKLRAGDGFTWRPNRETPAKGYVVSIYPEHEHRLTLENLSEASLTTYLKVKRAVLAYDPDAYYGGWVDEKTQIIYLDISRVVISEQEALKLGKLYKQNAIYDLANQRSLYLKPAGPGIPEPKKQSGLSHDAWWFRQDIGRAA